MCGDFRTPCGLPDACSRDPAKEAELIRFFVPGTPVTQGNHSRGGGHSIRETSVGHSGWRALVTVFARDAWRGREPMNCAVHLELWFFVPCLKGTKPGELPEKTGGDVSKLARAIEDSLEDAGIYTNDRRITDENLRRRYAFGEQQAGVLITVGPVKE